MNKLAVIYRTCNSELDAPRPIRPPYFNKYKCWTSFISKFINVADIYVVFDGDEETKYKTFLREYSGYNFEQPGAIKFIEINKKSNKESSLVCFDLARTLNNEYIFFAEDDYLYRDNSYNVLMEGLELSQQASLLVTLFDHPDRYRPNNGDITYGQEYILLTKNSHWKTCESTTFSIAMKKDYFNQLLPLFVKHTNEGRGAANDRPCYREILTLGYRVISPIPSLSSHIVINDLAPLIDWSKV